MFLKAGAKPATCGNPKDIYQTVFGILNTYKMKTYTKIVDFKIRANWKFGFSWILALRILEDKKKWFFEKMRAVGKLLNMTL